MGVNDWFDPMFLYKRIEKLLSYNDVEAAAASLCKSEGNGCRFSEEDKLASEGYFLGLI